MVAAGGDTLHRIDLNIPSIDATTMGGSITTHRTAINVSGKNQAFDVQITAACRGHDHGREQRPHRCKSTRTGA